MKRMAAISFILLLSVIPLCAQKADPSDLPRVKTAALVVKATTSVSCGDGSEGTCVRQDPDVVKKVTDIVDSTELWEHFQKADATKADAILELTVKNASTTYGNISFSVRDADNNNFMYQEYRDVVTLENDITRMVNHFLKAVEEAKKSPRAVQKH
jgi:hypothetical protein